MTTDPKITKETIRAELAAAHSEFHVLLDSLSEEDLHKRSLNPGWTNGEILAHMTFGFIILNALLPMARLWGRLPKGTSKPFAWLLNFSTRPFNWINAFGARLQGRVFTYRRIGKLYDGIYISLLKQAEMLKDDEWERGMYYPTEWDATFSDFMTLERLFCYPSLHLNLHLEQVAR